MAPRRPKPQTSAGVSPVPGLTGHTWLPLVTALLLAAFLAVPAIQADGHLAASVAGAAAILTAWACAVVVRARAQGRRLRVEGALLPEHYAQALAHASILVYWGFYWDPLRHAAALIAAQIAFAYAFDMLLSWSRRDVCRLGLVPLVAVTTINMFLRFRDDWFLAQFLMVACAVTATHAIRLQRDSRQASIFNPPAVALGLFSLGLIVTHGAGHTWAEEMSSSLLLPPQIYLFVFVVSLPAIFISRSTTVTLSAAIAVYGLSSLVLKLTGTYFFVDSTIPIAVFVALHLLVIDPPTLPRADFGRVVFGAAYGASVFALHGLLARWGAPVCFAPLLPIPLLNFAAPAIDRMVTLPRLSWPKAGKTSAGLSVQARSLASLSIWIVVFGAMSAANGVGDDHPGRKIQFWQRACREDRPGACSALGSILSRVCADESGWACNELGLLAATNRAKASNSVAELFRKACVYGQPAGCGNSKKAEGGDPSLAHSEPNVLDFRHLLRLGKARAKDTSSLALYTAACDEGWSSGCEGLSRIYFLGVPGTPTDKPRAAALALRACDGGSARSCSNVGLMYKNGDGVVKDPARALALLKKSCDLGLPAACTWLASEQGK